MVFLFTRIGVSARAHSLKSPGLPSLLIGDDLGQPPVPLMMAGRAGVFR